MRSIVVFSFLFACTPNDGAGLDSGPEMIGGVAVPVGTSSGYCPDMSTSQTTEFVSDGEARTVTMIVPEVPPERMALAFFFHGLLDPRSTPRPTEYMASVLNLQTLANEQGILLVLPQSGTMSRMGYEFFMWNVEDDEIQDLLLFDDLRACAHHQHNIDLTRVHAMGFSGGALFSTVIARERGDVLASLVEMSGGSDIEMLTFDDLIFQYETPQYAMPSLLISGGPQDQWPGGGVTLLDFTEATNHLADNLAADGHLVVRCEHSRGHTVPSVAFNAANEWISMHQFGVQSPIEIQGLQGLENFDGWCNIVK